MIYISSHRTHYENWMATARSYKFTTDHLRWLLPLGLLVIAYICSLLSLFQLVLSWGGSNNSHVSCLIWCHFSRRANLAIVQFVFTIICCQETLYREDYITWKCFLHYLHCVMGNPLFFVSLIFIPAIQNEELCVIAYIPLSVSLLLSLPGKNDSTMCHGRCHASYLPDITLIFCLETAHHKGFLTLKYYQ